MMPPTTPGASGGHASVTPARSFHRMSTDNFLPKFVLEALSRNSGGGCGRLLAFGLEFNVPRVPVSRVGDRQPFPLSAHGLEVRPRGALGRELAVSRMDEPSLSSHSRLVLADRTPRLETGVFPAQEGASLLQMGRVCPGSEE